MTDPETTIETRTSRPRTWTGTSPRTTLVEEVSIDGMCGVY